MYVLPLFLILLLNGHHIINSEVYTALVDLARVINAEKEINDIIFDYITQEEKRLKQLNELALDLKNFKLKNVNLSDDNEVEKYFSNPVNTYLFTRTFSVDWKDKLNILDKYSQQSYIDDLKVRLDSYKDIVPSDDDVNGAVDALLRLQETYQLKTVDLANGKINDIKSDYLLTAEDCLKIGIRAYEKKTYYVAVNWLKQAYELVKLNRLDDLSAKDDLKISILDYLAYCLGSIGRYKAALKVTSEMLAMPQLDIRTRIVENKQWYLSKLSEDKESVNENEDIEIFESEEEATYTALCRGESPINYPQNKHNLRCFLKTNHPFLKIRPLKVEVAFDKPRIYVLHDIIYDGEIEHIKKVAAPQLNRATVRNPQTGVLEYANYRISKSAWLPNEYDELTSRVNNRIKAITGLNIDYAEDLQVVNYGIGGHYSPHYDHGRKRPEDDFDIQRGNRIATLLFYMSDVEAGGATVFVDVGAQLWPRKGTAAFWYNLKRSGESDDMTRHAACPVLVGSKWVMNKWFRERGQELVKPCLLDPTL